MKDGNERNQSRSEFIFSLGVKQLMRSFVISVGHKHFGRAIQITIVPRGRINEFLRRGDAMFFQHHDEHLGVDHRTSIKKFHEEN